jgi:hypothetical protein
MENRGALDETVSGTYFGAGLNSRRGRVPLCIRKGVRDLAPRDTLPPILRWVLENAQQPRSAELDDAGRKLALHPYSREAVEEYIAAKRRSRP